MPEIALPKLDSERRLLAQHPDTSAEVLDQLARDPDRIVQVGVAKHPYASAPTLNRLALSQYWQVRMGVIGNPSTGGQALQYLAEIGPSFSQTARARHQLFRRGAERLPYQEALALRAVLESAAPSQQTETTQPADAGAQPGVSLDHPAEVRARMSKHLAECARCSLDQPCDAWDQLFARYQAAGVEPSEVRKSMQDHLEDCELCSDDQPCPEWEALYANFESVSDHPDDDDLSETPQPTADVDVAGSRESHGVPEVLSTGTVFQLLETATAYEVRAVDAAAGIPTSRYPRDPEGLSAAQAHYSRLEGAAGPAPSAGTTAAEPPSEAALPKPDDAGRQAPVGVGPTPAPASPIAAAPPPSPQVTDSQTTAASVPAARTALATPQTPRSAAGPFVASFFIPGLGSLINGDVLNDR